MKTKLITSFIGFIFIAAFASKCGGKNKAAYSCDQIGGQMENLLIQEFGNLVKGFKDDFVKNCNAEALISFGDDSQCIMNAVNLEETKPCTKVTGWIDSTMK